MKAERMRAKRLRVFRVREVARYLCIRPSAVWALTHDSESGFPEAICIPPSTFVWDQDEVEAWDRCRRSVVRRARAAFSALHAAIF